MSNKITNVSALSAVLNGEEITPEIREKLENMKASYEKRKATKRVGLTKTQIANNALIEQIASAMEVGATYTIAEIGGLVADLNGASSQKIAPLMKKLVNEGKVTTEKVKAARVLEINANHPIFAALTKAYAEDKDKAAKLTDVLYAQASLIEGIGVDDPVAYANAVCSLITE